MAPFILTPCTSTDLAAMVDIYLRAFIGTHVTTYVFPPATCTPASLALWLHTRFGRLLAGTKPGVRHYKIVDQETGNMVAWARWGLPGGELIGEERERWESERRQEQIEREKAEAGSETHEDEPSHPSEGLASAASEMPDKWPTGANVPLCEAYFSSVDGMRARHVRWEDDYLLYFLATDPAYQGRGLGTMLLQHGIALAEARRARIYLEATEEGEPLYAKLGWRTVDLVSIDFAPWGAARPGVNWIMRREPGGGERERGEA